MVAKEKKTNLFVHNLGVPIDGRQLFLSGCIFRFDFVVDFLKRSALLLKAT